MVVRTMEVSEGFKLEFLSAAGFVWSYEEKI